MNKLNIFLLPLSVVFIFFLFTKFYHHRCTYDPILSEISTFSYKEHAPLFIPKISFDFKGYIFPHTVKKGKISIDEMIENLKINVITGKKRYVLVDSVFIEEGKSYNGIKFLGIEDGEVIFEIDGRIYKKKF